MNRRKRACKDPHRSSPPADEEAKIRVKMNSLLQDFWELQKEFVSKKKKLEIAKQKKQILWAEVEFLRRRHRYLLEIQPSDSRQDTQVQGPGMQAW